MLRLPADHLRRREGFALTDQGMDLTAALDHANYCIFCHNQGKDSCRKGLRDRDGGFKPSPFGAPPLCLIAIDVGHRFNIVDLLGRTPETGRRSRGAVGRPCHPSTDRYW